MKNDVTSAGDSTMLFPDEDRAFLHAIPWYDRLNFIDITELKDAGDLPPHQIISKLLANENIETTLSGPYPLVEQLRNNYFADRNSQRLTGEPALGIGFPFFVWKKEEELIAAPLFIWECGLEPHGKSGNDWHFSFVPYSKSVPNFTLLDWLEEHYNFIPESILTDPLQHERLTAAQLTAFTQELSARFELDNPGQSISLMPFPTSDQLFQLETDGALVWSAVLGTFPPYPRQSECDLNWPTTTTYEQAPADHPFGLLVKDPHQAAAMDGALRHGNTIIEGEAGTGKTALLIDLVVNALSNGQKVMVVSKSLSALQANQRLLSQLGLSNFTFLLRNRHMDLVLLSDMIRANNKSKEEQVDFKDNNFVQLRDKLIREKRKLDEKHQALSQAVFGKADWAQTVGLFLSANRIEGKELLNNQLNNDDFQFNPVEFKVIRGAVDSCFQLFKNVNTLHHPLRNLNAGIFVHQDKEEGLAFVQKQTDELLEGATRLQYRYIGSQTEYGDLLNEHYEDYYRALREQINTLRDHLEDFVDSYGKDTLQSAKSTLKFYGLFSEKYRAAQHAQERLKEEYLSIKKQFARYDYIEHQFLSDREIKNLHRLQQNLAQLEEEMLSWRSELYPNVQEELLRLSSKTVHPATGFAERVEELEDELDLFIDELNGSGLYQLPLENKMLTLIKRQRFLEEVIEQLEATQLNLRDFKVFYDWQRHWFGLPAEARRVVKALIKVRPNDWGMAFESWYFNNALGRRYDPALPSRDYALARYQSLMDDFQPLLQTQILGRSQQRRAAALKDARKNRSSAVEKLLGKKAVTPGEEAALLRSQLDLVSESFPILLTTPAAAANLLREKQTLIDLILVDEAQDFPTRYAEPLLGCARRMVQFSNPSFENEKTTFFVSTAKVNGTPVYTLQQSYTSVPADLYSGFQTPVSEESPSVHFAQVDGRYNEVAQTNEEEIQYIFQLLNRIEETPQRTYPSVGIVCFTLAQRDLIAAKLLQIKQQRSTGVEKIQQLERNGLGVYHLEELSGQHFDIVVVSGTIGPSSLSGTMTGHLAYFQQYRFVSFLRQLTSRAAKAIHFINSIPESLLQRVGKSATVGSTANLLSYLAFAAAQAQRDEKRITAIRRQFTSGQREEGPHPLAEEIAWRLATRISTERLRLNKREGLTHIPLLIAGPHHPHPPTAILIDGFMGRSAALDYTWEYRRRQHIRQMGYYLFPVWSVQWWKNPKSAINRLLSEIDRSKPDEEE